MITKTRVSALLSKMLVTEIKKEAVERNATQSSIFEEALQLWLEKKLDEDAKSLGKMHFEDLPSENDWMQIQSQNF